MPKSILSPYISLTAGISCIYEKEWKETDGGLKKTKKKNGGNSHRLRDPIMHRMWGVPQSIFRSANHAASKKATRAPSQYPKRRLSVRSREVSKPRDWYFKLSYRFEIWRAHRQQYCRSACQISERSDNSKYKSRDFESLRDLMERRLFGYWDGVLEGMPQTPLKFLLSRDRGCETV